MDSTERAYYAALFRRDFREAQRLYRELVCGDLWTPDRVTREAHKCGLFDAADHDDDAPVGVITQLRTARELKTAA